jgi:hypothetical protein
MPRIEKIIEALEEADTSKLYRLLQTSVDEEEREFLSKRIQVLDNDEWAYDRAKDNAI